MNYKINFMAVVFALTGCASTPGENSAESNIAPGDMSSSSMCAAIENGSEFAEIYRDVLSERQHGCQGKLVVYGDSQSITNTPQASFDDREKNLNESFVDLLEQATSGKITFLEAARSHQENFFYLYPEHKNNTYVVEYLSYMAVLGEQVDLKKMTPTQAEYELAKKNTELSERAGNVERQKQAETEQARARQAQIVSGEQQAALMHQSQIRQERSSNLLNVGLQILQWNHEQALANQMRGQHCVWSRLGSGWVQTCQ